MFTFYLQPTTYFLTQVTKRVSHMFCYDNEK